jgi:hypothetical protein
MGLKIGSKSSQETKPAAKAKPVVKPTAKTKVITETQALVDELVTLSDQLVKLEVDAMTKRVAELKSRLQSIANETQHDQEVTIVGTVGQVVFSKCREETNIVDRDLMIKKLTPEVFVAVGKVGLTDIRKYLTDGEIQTFTEKVYGSRSLKVAELF